MGDEWAANVDQDQIMEVNAELRKLANEHIENGMHPEEFGMLFHFLTGEYKGRAENQTKPSAEFRLNFRLWDVIDEVADDDEYDLSWRSIAFVLGEMQEMAQCRAHRESKLGDGDE